jgi:hypothetical protein
MGSIDSIQLMLASCSEGKRVFPPTILYNEGWMLRLIVDWFARNRHDSHPLAFSDNAQWYSEALLPSPFLARYRGDTLSESYTHADGVIGNITIGNAGAGDLGILPDATQLVVLEAKMFSKLSSGVTHARYYNQAARNVACIAEVLKRGSRQPSKLSSLGFYVLAPECQIEEGVFRKYLKHGSIQETVLRRVSEYNDLVKEEWFENCFLPTLRTIDIRAFSWEELVRTVMEADPASGSDLTDFYNRCIAFNRPILSLTLDPYLC